MILKILYVLSKEIGLILSVVSFVFGIIVWFFPENNNTNENGVLHDNDKLQKKMSLTKKNKGYISGICALIIVSLIANLIFMQDYVSVPLVEGLEYSAAVHKLEEAHLNAVTEDKNASRKDYVKKQSVKYGEIRMKGETIVLTLSSEAKSEESTAKDKQTTTNAKETTTKTKQTTTKAKETTTKAKETTTKTKQTTTEINSSTDEFNTTNDFTEPIENDESWPNENLSTTEDEIVEPTEYEPEITNDESDSFDDDHSEPDDSNNSADDENFENDYYD